MIFKQTTFVDDKGRLVNEQVPQEETDEIAQDELMPLPPTVYIGTGQINLGPGGIVTLQYKIEAVSVEDAFVKTDAAFQEAAKKWMQEQQDKAKRIITGDRMPLGVTRIPGQRDGFKRG
jgi:hypothetical protein